jgi:glutamate synthase domain-containing protein 1
MMQCREISGCGLSGIISRSRELIPGEDIITSIVHQRERGNNLGAGYAGYGIYPRFPDSYAIHIMYDDEHSKEETENYLRRRFHIEHFEDIPTRRVPAIQDPPTLFRYFVKPVEIPGVETSHDDLVMRSVMEINEGIPGAFVFSSGKNMGAFKGVGGPEEIAEFFRIEEYSAHQWIAHTRFPTNTPGWWGGAHPFTLLDWAVVHNGEISSYGINKRYLEMFGYKCTLMTDTEVVAYLVDLLVRRHGLPLPVAARALAAPFWKDIDRMDEREHKLSTVLRMIYGSALLNGPFAVLVAWNGGMMGINDRIKLRPLVAAVHGDRVYMASEESAICAVCLQPDRVWAPKAGEAVIVPFDDAKEAWEVKGCLSL